MSKDERGWNSSSKEKPVRSRPRRLADWINLTGAKKVHSLIDKVYKRKNREGPWEKVKKNRGSGGMGGRLWDRWADCGSVRGAARPATGSAAARAERGHLSTFAGATTPDPEEGQTG